MNHLFSTIPNRITAVRLFLIPVLWVLAWLNLPVYIGVGMVISSATDFLDGYFARRLQQFSEFGGRFDAFADNLMFPSALVWLWMFQPAVYRDNLWLCLAGIGLYVSYIALGLIKFRQFANLHLHSTRVAAVMLYLFIPLTLITGSYSPLLFKAAIGLFLVSSVECLLVLMVIPEFRDDRGSLLFVLKNKTSRP